MKSDKKNIFETIEQHITNFVSTTTAFIIALFIIMIWIVTGPLFHYSDTWQLVINTGTNVITFLIVFLIQRTQSKDSRVVHLKLNEIVASIKGASNRLINSENLSEKEIDVLSNYCSILSQMAAKEVDLSISHSIEEVVDLHEDRYKGKSA